MNYYFNKLKFSCTLYYFVNVIAFLDLTYNFNDMKKHLRNVKLKTQLYFSHCIGRSILQVLKSKKRNLLIKYKLFFLDFNFKLYFILIGIINRYKKANN